VENQLIRAVILSDKTQLIHNIDPGKSQAHRLGVLHSFSHPAVDVWLSLLQAQTPKVDVLLCSLTLAGIEVTGRHTCTMQHTILQPEQADQLWCCKTQEPHKQPECQ